MPVSCCKVAYIHAYSRTMMMAKSLSFFPIAIIALLLCNHFPAVVSLRCVNCKGCAKFEESQAVTCPASFDKCLVKNILIFFF